MIAIQDIASTILVTAGIFAMLIGSIGIVRLPDFYTRTHAISMSDTLGILLVITGLIIHEGMTINSLKLFFIVLFVMLSNPIGVHALARAAYRRGVWPLFNPVNELDTGNISNADIAFDTGNPAGEPSGSKKGVGSGKGPDGGEDPGSKMEPDNMKGSDEDPDKKIDRGNGEDINDKNGEGT